MLEREVEIIKSLKHVSSSYLEYFKCLLTCARLQHHIVEYENYFEDDEYMYIVMEFVDGGDLLGEMGASLLIMRTDLGARLCDKSRRTSCVANHLCSHTPLTT